MYCLLSIKIVPTLTVCFEFRCFISVININVHTVKFSLTSDIFIIQYIQFPLPTLWLLQKGGYA